VWIQIEVTLRLQWHCTVFLECSFYVSCVLTICTACCVPLCCIVPFPCVHAAFYGVINDVNFAVCRWPECVGGQRWLADGPGIQYSCSGPHRGRRRRGKYLGCFCPWWKPVFHYNHCITKNECPGTCFYCEFSHLSLFSFRSWTVHLRLVFL